MRINSKITFEKYYAIYKRKEILGEVKSDDFIDFCLKLKLSGAKPKHILCYNLLESDLIKALDLIEPPTKKKVDLLGFLDFNFDEMFNIRTVGFNAPTKDTVKAQEYTGDDLVIFKTSTYNFREDQIVSIDSIREYYADGIINFMFFAGYIDFYKA